MGRTGGHEGTVGGRWVVKENGTGGGLTLHDLFLCIAKNLNTITFNVLFRKGIVTT